MNSNAVIAILVLKNIITEDEGQRVVDFIHDKPQSTVLKDAIADVAAIIGKPTAPALPQLGPVGPAQIAETLAAHAPDPVPAAEPVTEPEAPAPVADPPVGEGSTYEPETDEPAKATSVKKSTDKTDKK